ncbi:hypothetical protein O7623_12685 [Solwaraspora sp. WMMD791]|uniref:hypothetical protein n=1 Tax=Solwaraspora sp. WMMD791 TaxID=3016086 RepID=UPI00249A1F33|nr:hypothetical protein [Solwaraspora sp. WMMD791]WFE29983.1 hypothetical protein O7623_12685 [Solwaraspora sp. WMMD791]
MRTLLLFDGLGSTHEGLVPELRRMYASPENATFFQSFLDTVDNVSDYLGTTASADRLSFRAVLEQRRPGQGEPPVDSVAAGLCVYAYQTCHLQPTARHADGAVAALGHSIGMLAAVIAGLRLRRMDDFIETVTAFLRLMAVSLARAQELVATANPEKSAVDRYRAMVHRGADPGPMAALSGLPRHELAEMVDEFTRNGGSLSMSLANSPRSHVLSGPPTELLEFYLQHAATFERAGAIWTFLSNTIPFHSRHLASTVDRVGQDRRFIGKLPGGGQLQLAVYATDVPRNLQSSSDFVDEFLQQVFLHPIDWEAVTGHAVADAAIDRIVDYGPGAAARRFTKECLGTAARSVQFAPIRPSVASRAPGGHHAMSTLSRPGRPTPRNGR